MSERLDKLGHEAGILERQTRKEFWGTVVDCSLTIKEVVPTRRRLWLARTIEEIYDAQAGLCVLCREPLSPSEWEIDPMDLLRYLEGRYQNR
jgi:hypothetical protein